jgi:methionyl aminopeptidase
MVTRKSRREIDKMRAAGRIVAEVLALVESELKPGVSTAHLDRIAERHIRSAGAIPSFKGYGHKSNPFPASLCISIDDEVVHGIPGERTIKLGQIVSVDAGAIYDGWHGDAARTFVVGPAGPQVDALVESTRLAMMAGIASAVPGSRIGDISAAIAEVAHADGLSINTDFGGHGVGRTMHGDPHVPNNGRPGRGYPLKPGLVIAIEPWFLQTTDVLYTDPDGWTLRSGDGSRGAHMEHTIAVTDQGPLVLTAR